MGRKAKSKKVASALVDAIASSDGQSPAKLAVAQLGYRPVDLAGKIASPEQARAIKAHLVRRLVAESVPAAIRLLENEVALGLRRQSDRDPTGALKLAESAGTGALDAAKHLTNLGGLQAIAEEKDAADLTDQELRQALEQLQHENAKRNALDVAGEVSAPSDAPVDSQATVNAEDLFS